jgi:hypothetical protein
MCTVSSVQKEGVKGTSTGSGSHSVFSNRWCRLNGSAGNSDTKNRCREWVLELQSLYPFSTEAWMNPNKSLGVAE